MPKFSHIDLLKKLITKTGIIIQAKGISMYPTIKPGDRLFVSPFKKIYPGDIILFSFKNNLIAHRAILAKDSWVLTRADYGGFITIDKKNILGKIIVIKRGNKFVKLNPWIKIYKTLAGLVRGFDKLNHKVINNKEVK